MSRKSSLKIVEDVAEIHLQWGGDTFHPYITFYVDCP